MNPRLRGLGLGRVHVQLAAHVDDMLWPAEVLSPPAWLAALLPTRRGRSRLPGTLVVDGRQVDLALAHNQLVPTPRTRSSTSCRLRTTLARSRMVKAFETQSQGANIASEQKVDVTGIRVFP